MTLKDTIVYVDIQKAVLVENNFSKSCDTHRNHIEIFTFHIIAIIATYSDFYTIVAITKTMYFSSDN